MVQGIKNEISHKVQSGTKQGQKVQIRLELYAQRFEKIYRLLDWTNPKNTIKVVQSLLPQHPRHCLAHRTSCTSASVFAALDHYAYALNLCRADACGLERGASTTQPVARKFAKGSSLDTGRLHCVSLLK